MRTAVLTVASSARAAHVDRQRMLFPPAPGIIRVEAWLDAEPPAQRTDALTVHVPPGPHGLRVGAGRNAAARAALDAGAELLIFLDADCLAGPRLVERYAAAAEREPAALLCGPVTYLDEGVAPRRIDELAALTRPHPARPHPADDALERAALEQYDLFWSLSFAVSAATWDAVGGFSDEYEGYGAEDTDFAWRARAREVPLVWVGGADAYHQWHPTSSPPWQHLHDILRNGATFARTWGTWPMAGWIEKFADAGAVEWDGANWRRTSVDLPRPDVS